MTKRARVDSRSTSEGFKDTTLASTSVSQPNVERDIHDEMQGNTKDDESTDEDNDDLYEDEG